MYTGLVHLHSVNRYLLLIALFFVLYRAYNGWLRRERFEKLDNTASVSLLALTHLQLLIGLLLYFVYSQWTQPAFADMGAAMKNPWQRYFAVEHISVMLLAVVMVQLGRTFSKKKTDDTQKHRLLAIYNTIALLLIVLSLAPKGLLWRRVADVLSAG